MLLSIWKCEDGFDVSGESLFDPFDATRERCFGEFEVCDSRFQCDVELSYIQVTIVRKKDLCWTLTCSFVIGAPLFGKKQISMISQFWMLYRGTKSLIVEGLMSTWLKFWTDLQAETTLFSVHYLFHIKSLTVEKLLRKSIYSVMRGIETSALFRFFLHRLIDTLLF